MKKALFLSLAVLALVVSWAVYSWGAAWLNPRPGTLSLEFYGHDSAPTMRRLEWNGVFPARYRTTNLTDVGGVIYNSDWNNDLDFKMHWIELQTMQAYTAEFSIDVSTLSTFGDVKDHASLRIEIGAAGDVRVSTGNQQAMRLTGLKQFDQITDDMVLDRMVLQDLCGIPITASDPVIQDMIANGMEENAVRGAENRYKRWIAENPPLPSRCNK